MLLLLRYGPPPYYPYYEYYYDENFEVGFTIYSPYSYTNDTDVAFDDPGAAGGNGITVTNKQRAAQNQNRTAAKSQTRHTQTIVIPCAYHSKIGSGGGISVFVDDGVCYGAAVFSILEVTPVLYDWNHQTFGYAEGPTLYARFSGSVGGVWSARVTYPPGSIPPSQIAEFFVGVTTYPIAPGSGGFNETVHTVPYNNRYSIYPEVFGYRGGNQVPFPPGQFGPSDFIPNYSFRNCIGRGGTGGCAGYDSNFRASVINTYYLYGWNVPDPNQCHHIHPKFLGGQNDVNNGVPLSAPDHAKFTSWWTNTIYTQPFTATSDDPTCA